MAACSAATWAAEHGWDVGRRFLVAARHAWRGWQAGTGPQGTLVVRMGKTQRCAMPYIHVNQSSTAQQLSHLLRWNRVGRLLWVQA